MDESAKQTATVTFVDGSELQVPSYDFWFCVGSVLQIMIRLKPSVMDYLHLVAGSISSVAFARRGQQQIEQLVQNHPNAKLPTLILEITDSSRSNSDHEIYMQPFTFETSDDQIIFRQS